MALDFQALRTGDLANQLRESQQRRFRPAEAVDYVIALDEAWRKAQHKAEQLKAQVNKVQEQIKEKYVSGAKADAVGLQVQREALLMEAEKTQALADEIKRDRDTRANLLGNVVHGSVPVSKNEDNNGIVRLVGTVRAHDAAHTRPHHELLYMVDGYDPEPGARIAGHRGYFLKGVGLLLNQALINYGMAFLTKRGYTCMQTPFFMNKDVMAKTAQLADFDEQLYKVVAEHGEEKYLIATSEQPISAFHMNEWLDAHRLPLRYGGYSTNFRKEAGGYGRDVWGIFRVHQFEKLEQFCIVEPEKSWEMHEEMLRCAEEFFQSLGIAYRVVNIVSGELNDAAAKKYDVEGWFPGLNCYRELISCSNCTDFQSRRLNITTGTGDQKRFVHMLNSTLCATSRAICVLLETYQTEAGVKVPEVLQPFMGGVDFLKFVRDPPKHEPEPAAEAGGGGSGGGGGGGKNQQQKKDHQQQQKKQAKK